MRKIAASEFKAKCLSILDTVPAEGLEITKRGRVIARLYPESDDPMRLHGSVPGLVLSDDLLSTGERWDAQP